MAKEATRRRCRVQTTTRLRLTDWDWDCDCDCQRLRPSRVHHPATDKAKVVRIYRRSPQPSLRRCLRRRARNSCEFVAFPQNGRTSESRALSKKIKENASTARWPTWPYVPRTRPSYTRTEKTTYLPTYLYVVYSVLSHISFRYFHFHTYAYVLFRIYIILFSFLLFFLFCFPFLSLCLPTNLRVRLVYEHIIYAYLYGYSIRGERFTLVFVSFVNFDFVFVFIAVS